MNMHLLITLDDNHFYMVMYSCILKLMFISFLFFSLFLNFGGLLKIFEAEE